MNMQAEYAELSAIYVIGYSPICNIRCQILSEEREMKKSLAGIIAVVILLALIITGVIIGVSGEENAPELFSAEFTETVLVENGEALTKQTEKVFTVENSGKYVLNAEWKPDKEGLLTGCTITNEAGEIIFASTADWCTMESGSLSMDEGTYTLTLHYLTSKEQWYAFWYVYLINSVNSDRDNSNAIATDVEYTFATDGEFTIPFNIVIEKQSTAYLLGFMVGVGLVLVVFFVAIILFLKATKKDGSIKCKYDERQELMRGRGFKYAFFTLLIYNFIIPMCEVFEIELPADKYALFMIGAVLALVVHVVYSIWNEAYFSLNENPKKIMIGLAFIGFANLALGIMRIVDGTFITDGKLTFNSINFMLGIAFVIIFATLAAKQIVNKREDD